MILRGLVQRGDWDDLRELLLDDPSRWRNELTMRDRLGRTLLHAAATKRDIPPNVVQLIIQQTPRRLHWALDLGGNSALHMAAASGNAMTLLKLQEELQGQPTLLQYENDNGLTACGIAWKKFMNPSFTLFDSCDSGRFQTDLSPQQKRHLMKLTEFDTKPEPLRTLWHKTLVLCRAAEFPEMTYPLFTDGHSETLTALVKHGGDPGFQRPSIAVCLDLRSAENRASGTDYIDEKQNTLLHLACWKPSLSVFALGESSKSFVEEVDPELAAVVDRSVIAQLCHWDASAAKQRNSTGRLPIHLAILSGKTFIDEIQAVWKAHPPALEAADPLTGLPPLLLAARYGCTLTTVWEMLRHSPGVLLRLPTPTMVDEVTVSRKRRVTIGKGNIVKEKEIQKTNIH